MSKHDQNQTTVLSSTSARVQGIAYQATLCRIKVVCGSHVSLQHKKGSRRPLALLRIFRHCLKRPLSHHVKPCSDQSSLRKDTLVSTKIEKYSGSHPSRLPRCSIHTDSIKSLTLEKWQWTGSGLSSPSFVIAATCYNFAGLIGLKGFHSNRTGLILQSCLDNIGTVLTRELWQSFLFRREREVGRAFQISILCNLNIELRMCL